MQVKEIAGRSLERAASAEASGTRLFMIGRLNGHSNSEPLEDPCAPFERSLAERDPSFQFGLSGPAHLSAPVLAGALRAAVESIPKTPTRLLQTLVELESGTRLRVERCRLTRRLQWRRRKSRRRRRLQSTSAAEPLRLTSDGLFGCTLLEHRAPPPSCTYTGSGAAFMSTELDCARE